MHDTDSDERLVLHHVGGRSGSRPFPIFPRFEQDIISVLYEADPSCIEDMRQQIGALESEQRIFPYCLGRTEGKAPFYILRDQYRSSLLQLKKQNPGRYSYNRQFSWDSDPESGDVLEEIEVDLVTLDACLARPDFDAPPPDFLSLDVQGSELDVMIGAERTVRRDVMAVCTEAEFAPLYENQPLFGDILDHLHTRGFQLFNLEVFPSEGRSNRTPIGLRGRGPAFSGDALFLKDYKAAADTHPQPALGLLKLAFIAFVYDYFDYAIECLAFGLANYNQAMSQILDRLQGQRQYISFLNRLIKAVREHPTIYPVTYSDVFPGEDVRIRFAPNGQELYQQNLAKTSENYFKRTDPAYLAANLPRILNTAKTDVEQLVEEYGLHAQGEALKKRRLDQAMGLTSRLGLARKIGDQRWSIDLGPVKKRIKDPEG